MEVIAEQRVKEETHKTYILISNTKPISWKLRSNNVFQNRIVDGTPTGLRQIVYVAGGHSIWREDYPKDSILKFKAIWIEEGVLRIPINDKLMHEYLEAHPDYGIKFKLDDPERDAREELASLERLDMVKAMLAKVEDYSALAEALTSETDSTLHKTFHQKKLICYKLAAVEPDKVLTAMQDPKTDATYIVKLAFGKNIITVNPARTEILWGDTRATLLAIPTGKKHIAAMVDYIVEDKKSDLFTEIVKRLNGDKATKKKTNSKK